jgi:hypothetical protein
MSPVEVDSVLPLFCNKNKNKYAVYIINLEQGRGLDFPTNNDIE